MKNIIETLESIGQSVSVKQYASLMEMQKNNNIGKNILEKIEQNQADLVCSLEPDDDEDGK